MEPPQQQQQIIVSGITVDQFRAIIAEEIESVVRRTTPAPEQKYDDELIKVPEVARMLNVSQVSIHQWKKDGKLPFHRIGRMVFFKKEEVLQALKKIEKRR